MPRVCWSAVCSSALEVTSRSTVLCGAARKPARMSAVPTAADVYEMRLLPVMVRGVHSVGAAWRCLSSLRIYPTMTVLFHTPSGRLRSTTTMSPTSDLRVRAHERMRVLSSQLAQGRAGCEQRAWRALWQRAEMALQPACLQLHRPPVLLQPAPLQRLLVEARLPRNDAPGRPWRC